METRTAVQEKPVPGRKAQTSSAFPVAMLQRKCACGGTATSSSGECEECRKKKLQRRAADLREMAGVPPIVEEVLASSGQPLDPATREFMEPRFGHDFGHVRVHTDHKASESAKAVNALAYTVGNRVVFANGQYSPAKKSGQKLLAHELTHVVQQRKMTNAAPQAKLEIGPANDNLEQEADRFAEKVAGVSATAPAPPPASPTGTPNGSPRRLQRARADQTSATTAPAVAASGLIVDDEVQQLAEGQMHKTEFLDKLHAEVCATSDAALTPVGRTSQGCPFIEKWIARLRGRSGQHVEKAIRKYAPESAGATKAADYIAPVGAKVQRGVSRWAATGEITGVPPELMAEVAGGGILGAIGSAISGIIGGIGSAIAGVGHLFTKANDGGARPGNPLAIQSRLQSESTALPLESGVRARMEPAFGHSFGNVRVHAGSRAAQLSSSLNARAFTIGDDVAFAAGEYQPGTLIGDALIAHELAHVLQQQDAQKESAQRKRTGLASLAHVPAGSMARSATEYSSLEEDADVSAVGAIVSSWSGAPGGLREIGKNAMPRLRSGLKLQRCSSACDKGDRESLEKLNLCCTDDMIKKEINPTRAKAMGEVDKALGALRSSPKLVEGALKDNFSVAAGDFQNVALITSMLERMSAEMNGKRVTFVCRDAKDEQCKSSKPGHIKLADTLPAPSGPGLYIRFCANYEMAGFYNATYLTGAHWVRTFIHEYAHVAAHANPAAGVKIAPSSSEFYKEDGGYPRSTAENLDNADNYAWFVTDVAAGKGVSGGGSSQAAAPSASMTPWEIALLPDSSFALSSANANKQQLSEFARIRQVARAVYAEYGIKFDIDKDKITQLGRAPSKDELILLDAELSSILGQAGVSKSREAAGSRALPTEAAGKNPSLEGKVSIATTPGEFGVKRYQLELAITSGFGKDTSEIDGEVTKLWKRYKVTPGTPTDQERHLAMFVAFADNPFVPGFYSPLDDMIHLSQHLDLKKPDDVEVARHETLHLLGGRETTRNAFIKRYGEADYIRHWCIFEEGTAQLLTVESAPKAPPAATTKPSAPEKKVDLPAKPGESTVEVVRGVTYEKEVQIMKGAMAALGRETVLKAYFTGNIPEPLFKLFDNPPKTDCGQN